MRNIKLIIEYDGSRYCGWQRQPNGTSVQEVLEETIAMVTQQRVRLTGSGRTDAGVHALGQTANFQTESRIGTTGLLKGLNSLLPADIAVREACDVEPSFHARYDAKSKVYLYRIMNGQVRSPLLRNLAWHVREPLDIDLMKQGLRFLEGRHDFASFQAAGSDVKTGVRNILFARIDRTGPECVEIRIEADGFLRHMVRNIVGTLVDVGKKKMAIDEFHALLERRDRTLAGPTAPPQGLCLKEVKY